MNGNSRYTRMFMAMNSPILASLGSFSVVILNLSSQGSFEVLIYDCSLLLPYFNGSDRGIDRFFPPKPCPSRRP